MGLSGLGDGGDDDCDDYDCYSREYFGLLAWDGIYDMYCMYTQSTYAPVVYTLVHRVQ